MSSQRDRYKALPHEAKNRVARQFLQLSIGAEDGPSLLLEHVLATWEAMPKTVEEMRAEDARTVRRENRRHAVTKR